MTVARTLNAGASLSVPISYTCTDANATAPTWQMSNQNFNSGFTAAVNTGQTAVTLTADTTASSGTSTFRLDLTCNGTVLESRDFSVAVQAQTTAGLYMDTTMATEVLDSMKRKGEVTGEVPQTQCGRNLRNAYDNGAGQVRAPSHAGIVKSRQDYGWPTDFENGYNCEVGWFIGHCLPDHPAGNLAGFEVRRMFLQVLGADDVWRWVYRDSMVEGKMVRNANDGDVVVPMEGIGNSQYGERRTTDGFSTLFMRPFSEGAGGGGCNDVSTEVWPYPNLTSNQHVGDTNFFGRIDRSLFADHKARVGGVQVRITGTSADIASAKLGAQLGGDLYVRPPVGAGTRYITDGGVGTNDAWASPGAHPLNVLDCNGCGWAANGQSLGSDWMWLYVAGVDGAWGYVADENPPYAINGESNGTGKLAGIFAPYALSEAQFLAAPPLNPDFY